MAPRRRARCALHSIYAALTRPFLSFSSMFLASSLRLLYGTVGGAARLGGGSAHPCVTRVDGILGLAATRRTRCGLFLCWANLIAACAAHSGRRTRGHSFLGALAHISVGQIEAEPLCCVCRCAARARGGLSRWDNRDLVPCASLCLSSYPSS